MKQARRSFLLASGAALALHAQSPTLTTGEVLDRIRKNVGVPWRAETVDTLKAGTPETKVTGIATTFMATLDVLQRASAAGQNLVITHEPTFYAHDDNPKETAGDPVRAAKDRFIERNHMAIFRFHDHWHMRRPDGIRAGMLRALGWEKYGGGDGRVLRLPPAPLASLAADIKKSLKTRTMRVIGDPQLPVSRVALNPGYGNLAGSLRALANPDVDVLVLGEAREWEVYEYVQDAIAAGRKKALIVLGHAASEEGGMEECARWIGTFVPEVPVEHVPGEPFWAPPA